MKGKTLARPVLLKTGLALLFVGLLLGHASYYWPFIADDALISLRYADRLLHGCGLTWTAGRPVEGYSNLMWILLVAGFGKCGIDLIVAARLLGVLCMSGVIGFAGCRYLKRGGAGLFAFIVAMLFFVGTAPVAVWMIAGLEQPLVAVALAGAIFFFYRAGDGGFENQRSLWGASVCLGALCLTRPDGALFTAAFVGSLPLIGFVPWRTRFWRVTWAIAAVPAACYVGQLLFRLAYYGEWVPNTALVKVMPSARHAMLGLEYAQYGLLSLAPGSLLALLFFAIGVRSPANRKRFAPLLVSCVVWVGYLIAIGGDCFPAYRHIVPVVVIVAFALAEGAIITWEKFEGDNRQVFAALEIMAVLAVFPIQFFQVTHQIAKGEDWVWSGKALALTLRDAFADKQPLLGVTAAGCLPYWTGFPSLDMLGLNDYYLPRHKPKNSNRYPLGHELGDTEYVLRCAPDIIVFTAGCDTMFVYGREFREMNVDRHYAKIWIRTGAKNAALVRFNKNSGKIGFSRSAGRLTIPGYFLNAFAETRAYVRGGRLVIGVDANHPAGIVLNDAVDGEVTVLSPNANLIKSAVTHTPEGGKIVLTTQSQTELPVEGIVIQSRNKPPTRMATGGRAH